MKKRRIKVLSNLIALTVLAGCVFSFGCGGECKHEYTYTMITQPTCEQKGEVKGECLKCQNEIMLLISEFGHDYIDGECVRCKDGNECQHKYINVRVVEPTCEKNGSIEAICKYCGDFICQKQNALGHYLINNQCIRCGIRIYEY